MGMTKEELGKELAEWREASHMTIEELCLKTGLSKYVVKRMEGGISDYPASSLFKYLDCIQCSIWAYQSDINKTVIIGSAQRLKVHSSYLLKRLKMSPSAIARRSEERPCLVSRIIKGEGTNIDSLINVLQNGFECSIKIMPNR